MAIGSRKNRGSDYVFVNGRAVRSEDALGFGVQETNVPGMDAASAVPGANEIGPAAAARARASAGKGQPATTQAPGQDGRPEQAASGGRSARTGRAALKAMSEDDAFALRDGASSALSFAHTEQLMADDRRKMRRLYLIFGVVLLACVGISCCADTLMLRFRSPIEVIQGAAAWANVHWTELFDPNNLNAARAEAAATMPDYEAVVFQFGNTLKYAICGVMLSVSGMLYQNAFRNPIAAPSMLGVTNGVGFAILILVLIFGENAYQHLGLYYLFSYLGGALVLVLVILAGKWIGGRQRFNVVNMILVGTLFSQLLGVVRTYIEDNFMTDTGYLVLEELTNAIGITSVWTYVSVLLGSLVAIAPIIAFRFRLNLVSFSDEETKFLGVDPTKLRVLALSCGSLMILTAQVNAGQVAMMSLVVPFVVRAVFGSEFRKQLVGNVLVGAILLVVCGVLAEFVVINNMGIGLGGISTILALPLFVWMIAIRQRSWD